MPQLLDLEHPEYWPEPIRKFLHENRRAIVGFGHGGATGHEFDRAIKTLDEILQQYSLTGWHCTRLTQREIHHIQAKGMQPPNLTILQARIDQLVEDRSLTTELG